MAPASGTVSFGSRLVSQFVLNLSGQEVGHTLFRACEEQFDKTGYNPDTGAVPAAFDGVDRVFFQWRSTLGTRLQTRLPAARLAKAGQN